MGKLISLHLLFLVYAASGVCMKSAGIQEPMGWPMLLFYALGVVLLFLYALGWQVILGRMPLHVAYANKAVSIIWYALLGCLLFGEHINIGFLCGAALIITGIVIMAYEHR